MRIWAIADLHLSFGVPEKSMDMFGPAWTGHADKLAANWRAVISADDLVLIPGDISWAMNLEDAIPDLQWIHELPGTKVLLKGNHDYWWGSLAQIAKVLPPSIHLIQNNAFHWRDVAVGGARLWDTPEYGFGQFVEYRENPRQKKKANVEEAVQADLAEKQFVKELQRLEMSLKMMRSDAKLKIAMTHYPPVSAEMHPSRASAILEKYGMNVCVFGHIHNIRSDAALFGEARGVRYVLSACDYVRFQPVPIA